MPIEVRKSSPKADAIRENKSKERESKSLYDFEVLEVGMSFTVPLAECNWKSLRTTVYKKNKEYRRADGSQDREFAFIKHDELNLVEVARIA